MTRDFDKLLMADLWQGWSSSLCTQLLSEDLSWFDCRCIHKRQIEIHIIIQRPELIYPSLDTQKTNTKTDRETQRPALIWLLLGQIQRQIQNCRDHSWIHKREKTETQDLRWPSLDTHRGQRQREIQKLNRPESKSRSHSCHQWSPPRPRQAAASSSPEVFLAKMAALMVARRPRRGRRPSRSCRSPWSSSASPQSPWTRTSWRARRPWCRLITQLNNLCIDHLAICADYLGQHPDSRERQSAVK